MGDGLAAPRPTDGADNGGEAKKGNAIVLGVGLGVWFTLRKAG
jgi:hypothetical protein